MEALRSVELTGTNSPCALYLNQKLPSSLSIYILANFLVAIEKRVHPIPFRTRKLSSLSPMILHIFMWESRPPPRIFRKDSVEHLMLRSLFFCASPDLHSILRYLLPASQANGRPADGQNRGQCSTALLQASAVIFEIAIRRLTEELSEGFPKT